MKTSKEEWKMTTEITKLLGIKYPIIQGGMAWVADFNLAAAVSNAGGLGIIGSGRCTGCLGQRANKRS